MLDFLIFVALVSVLVGGFRSKGPARGLGALGLAVGIALVLAVLLVVAARFEGGL